MPVLRSDANIHFTTAAMEEKKDIIEELLQKQKELAAFTCQKFILEPSIRIYLRFIVTVCNSNFSGCLFNHIENKNYETEEFTSLFAEKLDNYMCKNLGIDF